MAGRDADRVLAEIDDVLAAGGAVGDDLEVSGDAVRWTPDLPEPARPAPAEPDPEPVTWITHRSGWWPPTVTVEDFVVRRAGRDGLEQAVTRRTVLAGPSGEPLDGTDRMAYVEFTVLTDSIAANYAAGYAGDHAEALAEMLGFTVTASYNHILTRLPFDPAARGFDHWDPRFLERLEGSSSRVAQGCALASWEPVVYPLDGDWRASWWFAPSAGHGRTLADDAALMDADVRERNGLGLLTDPIADLPRWYGVNAERAHMTRLGAADWTGNLEYRQAVYDLLQRRRDSQAEGKPLWAVNLLPEPLRGPSWEMYACRATDTNPIPHDNLDALRSRLAHGHHAQQAG